MAAGERAHGRASPFTGVLLAALLPWSALVAMACGSGLGRGEGLDRAALPSDVRADYDLFARRCSKCHSLARPLTSGIDDDDYWRLYVRRMRRQPGSGISAEDEVSILRFLHFYSEEERRKKTPAPSPPAPERESPPPPRAGG